MAGLTIERFGVGGFEPDCFVKLALSCIESATSPAQEPPSPILVILGGYSRSFLPESPYATCPKCAVWGSSCCTLLALQNHRRLKPLKHPIHSPLKLLEAHPCSLPGMFVFSFEGEFRNDCLRVCQKPASCRLRAVQTLDPELYNPIPSKP